MRFIGLARVSNNLPRRLDAKNNRIVCELELEFQLWGKMMLGLPRPQIIKTTLDCRIADKFGAALGRGAWVEVVLTNVQPRDSRWQETGGIMDAKVVKIKMANLAKNYEQTINNLDKCNENFSATIEGNSRR